MPTFATLVTLFYLCDTAATFGQLNRSEVAQCMANYEMLKLTFVEGESAPYGSPERAEQNRDSYRAWKSWEAENPDVVQTLKAQALARLGAI